MRIACFLSASCVAKVYHDAAYELGYRLGQEGHTLVFGGYRSGTMASIADGFADAEAFIIGVVPDVFENDRIKHRGLREVYHTKDLSDRKQKMIELSDAFIALPGGTGTLDELFEVMTGQAIRVTSPIIIIYNQMGFYDHLIAQLKLMEQQGFIHKNSEKLYHIASSPDEVIAILNQNSEV